MTEAMRKPFVEEAARFPSDLVNTDFPSEQEFKHQVSKQRPYRRRDFCQRVFFWEQIERSGGSPAWIAGFLISGVVLAALAVVVNANNLALARLVHSILDAVMAALTAVVNVNKVALAWLVHLTNANESAVRLGVIATAAGPFFVAAILFVSTVLSLSFVSYLIGREPPKTIDLAVRYRRLRRMSRRRIWFDEFSEIRPIWLGGGEVKFGCGPKGISVEHDYGYLYLLRWEKVDLIYDSKAPDRPPFTHVENVPLFDSLGVPNPLFADDLIKLAAIAAGQRNSRHSPWGSEGIHIRLLRVDPNAPQDELIVPYRFFERTKGFNWDDFMRECWAYKYHLAHPHHQGGKTVGSIEFHEVGDGHSSIGEASRTEAEFGETAA
ncbi:MAG: hypothetical protein WAW96_10465 [Alphaproteobacteria bacterium]